jgi:hypothetical protein
VKDVATRGNIGEVLAIRCGVCGDGRGEYLARNVLACFRCAVVRRAYEISPTLFLAELAAHEQNVLDAEDYVERAGAFWQYLYFLHKAGEPLPFIGSDN